MILMDYEKFLHDLIYAETDVSEVDEDWSCRFGYSYEVIKEIADRCIIRTE